MQLHREKWSPAGRLFAVTVVKVLLYDTSELIEVQRMASFLACGALLVLAGYFYRRFGAVLLQDGKNGGRTG